MAKVISQETYDEAFRENLELINSSVSEAREETITQFEAMGVNLANIITDLTINESTGVPIINETMLQIKLILESSKTFDDAELKKMLLVLNSEMAKSIPHRVLACNKLKANEYLLQIIEQELLKNENFGCDSILNHAIICMNTMTNKNPDIFNEKCHKLVLEILKSQNDIEVVVNTLKWTQKSCYLHEGNRQMIMDNDSFLKHLKILLNERTEEWKILKSVNACFRFLVLDDDIRVEFGKAHDHAKMIAAECLTDLTTLMKKFENDADVFSDILLTISTLLVRNEYCQTVADAGGVSCILNAFIHEFQNQNDNIKVVRESLKVLKALSGNDNVKLEIIKQGAAASICMGLVRFKTDETIAKSALLCISSLTLRVKENSIAFWETGIGETILETMKIHEKSAIVQRNGAWAIRNMVSRSREQCPEWLSLGAEDILTAAMKNHPSIEPDAKAALRDLGAKVKLKEEWKEQAEKREKPISHNQN